MAGQYDGSIRINTAIETDGFISGGKEVEAAVRRMVKTVSGIGATAKVALQKQADAFVKQNQAYAQQEKKVESLKEKFKELSETEIPTEEFAEIGKQIDNDTTKLNRLLKTQEDFLDTGGKESSSAYKRRQLQIEELRNSIRHAKAEQSELLASGGAYTTPDTSGLEQKIATETQKAVQMQTALGTSYEALKVKVQSYGGQIPKVVKYTNALQATLWGLKTAAHAPVSILKALGKGITSLPTKIPGLLANGFKKAGSALLGLNKKTKKTNMSLGKMLATSLLFSTVFRAISAVTNGIKEGMTNLAQYSGITNASISSLMSALTQLKNSFATAFAPILNVVAPILTTFINLISKAVTYVGMFFAALTGQKTFTKAVAVQEDYAAATQGAADATNAANKANEEYLSGLDEVTKWEDKSSGGGAGGGGGGGGAGNASDMFETVEIPSMFDDLADKIRDAWEKADFTEIGTIVGTKLKDALNNIPWDEIKAAAEKIAKSIATFINGFVETPGLWQTVGNTLAQGLNTALTFFDTLISTLHFDSIGSAITTSLQSAFRNTDFSLVTKTLSDMLIAVMWYKKS